MKAYIPAAKQLNGWSYDKAHLMGMPHVLGSCVICKGKQTNKHHIVQKGMGAGSKTLPLHGKELESPLFGVCGSGTTPHHSEFHNPRLYRVDWLWYDATVERQWWEGELFYCGLEPHSADLYTFGKYVIYKNDEVFSVIDHA